MTPHTELNYLLLKWKDLRRYPFKAVQLDPRFPPGLSLLPCRRKADAWPRKFRPFPRSLRLCTVHAAAPLRTVTPQKNPNTNGSPRS